MADSDRKPPTHVGTTGQVLIATAFGFTMWLYPDTKQPPPGLEAAAGALASVIIGTVARWIALLSGKD
jgi:hypothetical protein